MALRHLWEGTCGDKYLSNLVKYNELGEQPYSKSSGSADDGTSVAELKEIVDVRVLPQAEAGR